MDDWHVSGSESDSCVMDDDALHIGGIKMRPEKLRDMLQMVEKRKTLELDAITDIRRKERKKRRNRKNGQKIHSPGKEEVSETASEIPSVELRDAPRTSLSAFDYLNDDPSSPDSTPSKLRRVGAPKRDRKLAKLDGILADLRKEKRTCIDRSAGLEDDPWTCNLPVPAHAKINSFLQCTNVHSPMESSTTPLVSNDEQPCSPELPGFDTDEDSDEASTNGELNIKHRVLSQIIKVEKLLDAEGLS